MNLIKVYSVTFMKYTNCSRDTIASIDTDIKDTKYIKVNKEGFEHAPFLIKESDIDYYKNFGGGIKELIFVGYMLDVDLKEELTVARYTPDIDPGINISNIDLEPVDRAAEPVDSGSIIRKDDSYVYVGDAPNAKLTTAEKVNGYAIQIDANTTTALNYTEVKENGGDE